MKSCYHCDSVNLVITCEDDLVCSDCGRVNQETTSCDYANAAAGSWSIETYSYTWDVSNLLLDIFARVMIPTFITDRVLLQYSKLKPELKDRYNTHEIAAYATYKTLIEEKIPRLLSEIAEYFDIDRSKLRRLASEQCQSDVNPHDLLSPVLNQLKIPFRMSPEIETEIDVIRQFSAARPETVLACSIFRIVKKTPYRDLKCSDIASACGVSTASVRSLNAHTQRCIKNKKDNVQNLYLLLPKKEL